MTKQNKKKLNPSPSIPNQGAIEALGASPPQPTPAAEDEYVSPSQPLDEKPKYAKPRKGRATASREKKSQSFTYIRTGKT